MAPPEITGRKVLADSPAAFSIADRRDSSLRQLEQRRSRQRKEAAQIGRALIDERNREEFAAPEMATVARKNGTRGAPEVETAGSEPLRKSQNGHG